MVSVFGEGDGEQSERMPYTETNPCLEVHDDRNDVACCG